MSNYLHQLFDHLNSSCIEYFLLTDFESDFSSNDIDLFVAPAGKQAFEKKIFELGWYRRKEPAFHKNHFFYISPSSEQYLDVKYSLTFAKSDAVCCTYSGASHTISDSVLNEVSIYRPKGFDAVMLYAAHLGYKERGKLEGKHKAYLQKYISLYLHEIGSEHLGVIEQIQEWLDREFPLNTAKLQQILNPYFIQERKKMIRSTSTFKYGYGLSVLFLGTDGVGKTTLVEAVGKKLNIKNNRLYLGTGESNWSSETVKKIYTYNLSTWPLKKAYNLFKTFAVLPLEYMLRIAPVVRKSKYTITLIDRFPGFVYQDKNAGPKLLYKFILPDPDLVFFLHAAPEVLVKRKPHETSLERSIADTEKFRTVANKVSNGKYKSIDTSSMSISEASDLIVSEIYNHPKLYKHFLIAEPCN
ncbi:hypothetical protein [Pontibacter ruber]|uniref:Thymidylate kinase-like domain-containing protein n=1 Tax=Pontibacter ruber TaxID=1343895 RepID=A0ABW5D002_9BACT|nr:hypothetical protein [Pontibacter ruber]